MRLVLLAVTLQLQRTANFGSCQKTVEFSSAVFLSGFVFFVCFVPAGCDSDRLEGSREDIRQSCRPGTTSHHPACQPYRHSHTGWKGWVRMKNGRMDDLQKQFPVYMQTVKQKIDLSIYLSCIDEHGMVSLCQADRYHWDSMQSINIWAGVAVAGSQFWFALMQMTDQPTDLLDLTANSSILFDKTSRLSLFKHF